MAMEAHDIEALLRVSFPQAKITITDLAGDGNHYAAEVIDESFRGLNRVQQQRAVYAALQGKMDDFCREIGRDPSSLERSCAVMVDLPVPPFTL